MRLHELTAVEAIRRIRAGEVSPVELVDALLHRIEETEPNLGAWVLIDGEAVRETARSLAPAAAGELAGVPFGVKDVIDVAGLPTACGFGPWRERVAATDATSVARLRAASGIPLGKAVTTQFASRDPSATRSPWDPARSPGGSSSGSAVAVAACQVPFALGTQTGGSVLRPAAYNGVVGFKPTFGRVSKAGVFPDAWSLDHVGVLARSVTDCRLVLRLMEGPDGADPASRAAPPTRGTSGRRPRLGLLVPALEASEPEVREAVAAAVRDLRSAGAAITEVTPGWALERIHEVHQMTMGGEMAAVHRRQRAEHGSDYAPKLSAFLDWGAGIPAWAYVEAQRDRAEISRELEAIGGSVDALLLPTADGLPPAREAGTGSSFLQGIFSLSGMPSISLPLRVGPEGLPRALQLAAPSWQDEALLETAAWCEARLEPSGSPPLEVRS